MDIPTHPHSKNRNKQQQSDNELDSPQIDAYGSNTSVRRKSIFQSLKLKKEKIPLPRPSSALGSERDNEKQNRKHRRSTGGTLRPARVSILLIKTHNLYDKNDVLEVDWIKWSVFDRNW